MKIKLTVLERIIREELASHVKGLIESPRGHDVADAHSDSKEKERNAPKDAVKPQADPDNTAGQPKTPKAGVKPKAKPDDAPADQELEKDPADADLDKDAEDDAEGNVDAGEKRVSDDLVGKSIQSITVEPKSKIMPGAQEIVLTFSDIPDAFRILVTKSGRVAYYFKGLHNEL